MKTLPEELLTRIFEELEPKDLLHVSRSSKKFARLAAPILYKRCEFAQRSYGRQRQDKKRILRTLASKPHFAKFVQHISLGSWLGELPVAPEEVENGDEPISSEEARSLVRCVPMLVASPLSQQVELCLMESMQDPLMAVLLGMLPNLKSLNIYMDHAESSQEQRRYRSAAI